MFLSQVVTSLSLLFIFCAAAPLNTPNSISTSGRGNAASEPRAEVASIKYTTSESDNERSYAFILSEYKGEAVAKQFLCDRTLRLRQLRGAQVSIRASSTILSSSLEVKSIRCGSWSWYVDFFFLLVDSMSRHCGARQGCDRPWDHAHGLRSASLCAIQLHVDV